MKASRFLYLVPTVVLAAAAIPACGSSKSTGGSDSGIQMMGTGTGTGVTNHMGTGTGTGTGHTGTGPGSGSGTSTGTGPGGSGTGTGVVGDGGMTGGGCKPGALPANFTPAAHPSAGPTSCTAATAAALATQCFVADGGTAMECQTDLGAACGKCALTPNTSPTWGAIVIVPPTGATNNFELFLNNLGGCIMAADPSTAGQACGKALQEDFECDLAACIPSCPVTDQMDTAGQTALLGDGMTNAGCFGAADNGVCMTYANATTTACATEFTEAGTGAGDLCVALLNNQNTPLPTLFGAFCGGVDAGL